MYLKINGTRYSVRSASVGAEVRYTVDDPPGSLSGTVELYADDDMPMRTDAVSGYQNPRTTDGVIILSNTPEPAAVASTPTDPEPDPVATLAETVANLLYQIDTDKLTGGTTT